MFGSDFSHPPAGPRWRSFETAFRAALRAKHKPAECVAQRPCPSTRALRPCPLTPSQRIGVAPQAKVFASSVTRDRNLVGSVGRDAAAEEVRGTFVVGIPSDRSVCTNQVLVEVDAVGGFTSAGKPPPELLCRSGIRSYGLVCCA